MARPGEESAGAFEYRDKGGLVVTADPEKADDLHEVARDLRDAGVRVDVVPDPTEVDPPYSFSPSVTDLRLNRSWPKPCGAG